MIYALIDGDLRLVLCVALCSCDDCGWLLWGLPLALGIRGGWLRLRAPAMPGTPLDRLDVMAGELS